MVIDTSALCTILFNEEDAALYERAIECDPVRLVSVATLLETAIVVEARYGEAGGREFDLLVYKAQLEGIPVTMDQFEIARQASSQYGKGNHPAGLNFGDCFSYALSMSSGEPLLFKGSDFNLTDIKSVDI
jgi:ribonuclease VapC